MDNLQLAHLNEPLELILVEPLAHDIEPIARLAAYLCLRYHVQASIKAGWGDDRRPSGFFDLLRNIFIVTDEDDGNGILALELRVFIPQDVQFPSNGSFPIPEIALEKIGSEWFVEKAELHMQTQWNHFHEVTYNTDIDFDDPLLNAFKGIGFNYELNSGWINLIPDDHTISVDIAVETFLAYKPGAKRSPLFEYSK